MNIPKWIFIVIHAIMVTVSGSVLLFSTNLTVLTIIALCVLVIFCSCIYFDGCITTKMEDPLPFVNAKPTELVKRMFFVERAIEMKEIEKVLIGLTLIAYLAKVSVLYGIREFYGMNYTRFLAFLSTQKGIGQIVHSLLV